MSIRPWGTVVRVYASVILEKSSILQHQQSNGRIKVKVGSLHHIWQAVQVIYPWEGQGFFQSLLCLYKCGESSSAEELFLQTTELNSSSNAWTGIHLGSIRLLIKWIYRFKILLCEIELLGVIDGCHWIWRAISHILRAHALKIFKAFNSVSHH